MRCLSVHKPALGGARVASAQLARARVQAPVQARRALVVRAVAEDKDVEKEEEPEFIDLDAEDDGAGLSTEQVMQLTDLVCNETNLASVGVKMGDFEFTFTRSAESTVAAAPAPAAAAAPAPAPPAAATPTPAPAAADSESDEEDEEGWEDESLIAVTAPKVGILRRGRYVKGRRVGKGNLAQVGDTVKKGQALAFVEQLGTYVPVEASQAGEIVSFMVDEGEPVEYMQDVIKVAPFFGGHIIGDSKHA